MNEIPKIVLNTCLVACLYLLLGSGCSQVGTLTVRSIERDDGNTSCRLRAKNRMIRSIAAELAGALEIELNLADTIDEMEKISADISDENCQLVLEQFAVDFDMELSQVSEKVLLLEPAR